MKKIFLISILILETVLIVLLGIHNLQKVKETMNLRLEMKANREDLQAKEAKMLALSKELEESKKVQTELEGRVRELTEARKVLEAKMEGMRNATDTLAKQFDAQQKDIFKELDNLTEKNKETIIAFLDKVRNIVHMRMSTPSGYAPQSPSKAAAAIKPPTHDVTLRKIVVKKAAATTGVEEPRLGPEPVGTILNVDNKYNLVIVDVGQEKAVKPGMQYAVLRGERQISQIILREVYKGMSVAEAVPEKTSLRIKQGDKIIPLQES